MICKLDLEKVYDHVNWEFLFVCFKEMRFWGEVEGVDVELCQPGVVLGHDKRSPSW